MRQAAGIDVGDVAEIEVAYDPTPRTLIMHGALESALKKNPSANIIFQNLTASRQQEIIRYNLKTEAVIPATLKK